MTSSSKCKDGGWGGLLPFRINTPVVGKNPTTPNRKFWIRLFISAHLGDDELGILGAVEEELAGNVGKGDPGVGEGDGPHRRLHHVVVQPHDEAVRVVSLPNIRTHCLF